MKAIGFKNFRKYKEFPMMELSSTTILVGANNSGKSTIVKALLLINEIVNNHWNNFTFISHTKDNGFDCLIDLNKVKHLPLGSFESNSHQWNINNEITLSWVGIDNCHFSIFLKSSEKGESLANINKFIYESTNGLSVTFDFSSGEISVDCGRGCEMTDGTHLIKADNECHFNITMEKYSDEDLKNISIVKILKDIMNTTRVGDNNINATTSQSNQQNIKEIAWIAIREVYQNIKVNYSWEQSISYFPAYGLQPRSIYTVDNSVDPYSNAIIGFCSIINNHWIDELNKWLIFFGIGKSIRIDTTVNSYIIYVRDENGECNLSDKGLGAIRIVAMLMNLYNIIDKYVQYIDTTDKKYPIAKCCNAIVILEEPEQNLHPSAQSKLAELFFKISNEYGIQFVVETHSEYLVRKTQAIVARLKLQSNEDADKYGPYKTYCIPSNGVPYSMGYRKDGYFAEKFTSGFFDESSKLFFLTLN